MTFLFALYDSYKAVQLPTPLCLRPMTDMIGIERRAYATCIYGMSPIIRRTVLRTQSQPGLQRTGERARVLRAPGHCKNCLLLNLSRSLTSKHDYLATSSL